MAKTIKGDVVALAIEEAVSNVVALRRERKVGKDHKGQRSGPGEETVGDVAALAIEETNCQQRSAPAAREETLEKTIKGSVALVIEETNRRRP